MSAIRAAREEAGPDITLTVDVNCPWTLTEARAHTEQLKAVGLKWLEEPLWPPENFNGLAATYDLPYTTGPLARQYLLTLRTVCKLALPDRFLSATSDDAPETASETASEDKFRNIAKRSDLSAGGDVNARRRGLGTAILDRKNRRAAS